MNASEISLEIPGLRLAGTRWGDTEGLPVLALHGWLDNAASFNRLAPLLEGCTVVAPDLPGHGRSEHLPVASSYHFVDWVPRVLAAADCLGWQRFVLLGHSMGAGIASLVPAAAPERVRALVLIEGIGPLSAMAEDAASQLRRALTEEQRNGTVRSRHFSSFDDAVTARLLESDLSTEAARILVARATEAVPGGIRFRHDRRLQVASRVRFTEEQVHSFLQAIRCPVLALRARPGWPFPEQLVETRMRQVAALGYQEVAGGHHVHLCDAAAVAPVVNRFLVTLRDDN